MSKQIDLRFIVEDDVEVLRLSTDIGMGNVDILEVVELTNDGFGNIVPDERTRVSFV